jgi:hypothetical protein
MATSADSSNNKKARTAAKDPQAPPEERFWKRYSPHHEFSISSSSSLVLHILAFGVLILGGILIALGSRNRPVEVSPIVIAGGGGSRDGSPGPNTGSGNEKELLEDSKPEPEKKVETSKEEFKPVESKPAPILPPPDEKSTRTIEDTSSTLLSIGEGTRQKLNKALGRGNLSKGKGGPGEGGGKGKGKGTGTGDLEGPGTFNNEQRAKRQLRWTMTFDTRDGDDYLRQLQYLKAILVVESSDGQYLVFEDFRRRPAVPVVKADLKDINRIYWVDDRPESVRSLARALQIEPPARFVAFFPIELEKELLKKELEYRHLTEDDIQETRFRVRRTGGGYHPVVVEQTRVR